MAKRSKSKSPGWRRGEFLAGIAVGLVLALWVYPIVTQWWTEPSSVPAANDTYTSPEFDFYTRLPLGEELVEETTAATRQPAATSTRTSTEPLTEAGAEPSSSAISELSTAGPPEPETGPPAPTAVETPGMYVLQLGAFTRQEQAESLKARLALVGMNARIQPVRLDRQMWYRVRIGPTTDLQQLNADRARLQEHRFNSQLIRLVQQP